MDSSSKVVASPELSSSPRRITVVVSDVHLSQAHPEDPADPMWMRYRRADLHPDADFAALVDHLLATRGADPIELVFNGDVLDFDAPWVKDGHSSFDEFPLTEDGCAEQTARILADHPVWFAAAARVLTDGHPESRVLFTSGNHDLELYWPKVRDVIRAELVRLSAGRLTPEEAARRIRFRAWFHVTEDGIYLEHGSQYDFLNNVRNPMLPLTSDRQRIHPVLGKLAFKRTGSRMGYFNPYYEETFYLGLTGYLGHFLSHYAFSGHRHIARTWAKGSLSTILEIWQHRFRDDRWPEGRALAMDETGATADQVDQTFALRNFLAEDTMVPILRELWVDRVAYAVAALGLSGIAGVALGWKAALKAAGVLGALLAAYELLTPKPDIRTYDTASPEVKRLFAIHGVRAICMGHTHRPYAEWDHGPSGHDRVRVFANSGSWCPAFHDPECTRPVLAERPVIILTTAGSDIGGGLHWWNPKTKTLRAEEGQVRPEPVGDGGTIAAPWPAAAPSTASATRST